LSCQSFFKEDLLKKYENQPNLFFFFFPHRLPARISLRTDYTVQQVAFQQKPNDDSCLPELSLRQCPTRNVIIGCMAATQVSLGTPHKFTITPTQIKDCVCRLQVINTKFQIHIIFIVPAHVSTRHQPCRFLNVRGCCPPRPPKPQ
jgi:hypothetical protein